MHEVLVNRLGGLSLPRKSVVRLTDRPDMTLDVYRGRKTTNQQINNIGPVELESEECLSCICVYTNEKCFCFGFVRKNDEQSVKINDSSHQNLNIK